MADIGLILSALRKVKRVGEGKWLACCPVHNDRSPSLAVTQKPDGIILIRCFGCGATGMDVCGALGIEPNALFPPTDNPRYKKQSRSGFSAWQLLNALQKDLIFLVVAANQMLKDGAFDQADVNYLTSICQRVNDGLRHLEGATHG